MTSNVRHSERGSAISDCLACFAFQSFPHNDHKIKTILTGTMYAYELAPPSVIPPLSVEEERAMTLPQIQRLQHSRELRYIVCCDRCILVFLRCSKTVILIVTIKLMIYLMALEQRKVRVMFYVQQNQ